MIRAIAAVLVVSTLSLTAQIASNVVPRLTPKQLNVTWDPNSEPDIAGYRLYIGKATRAYESVYTVSATNDIELDLLIPAPNKISVPLPPPGLYYLAVTAYTTNGFESDFSDEIAFSVPVPPKHLKITVNLQSTAALGQPWADGPQYVSFDLDADDKRFYRSVVSVAYEN